MSRIKGIIYLLSLLVFTSCDQNKKTDVDQQQLDPSIVNNPVTASSPDTEGKDLPKFKFETEEHDFGTITEGEKVSFAFKFVNTGEADLLIRSASGSCGCTVPEYPKEAIKAGKGGVINVTFDSSGKS